MECPECFVSFNEVGRLPKALPCGHTFCLACLEETDRCFQDHKVFQDIPSELPNNHNVLAMMRTAPNNSDKLLSVWCRSCDAKASDSCIDVGHKICSRKKVLFEQSRQKVQLSEKKLDLQHYCDLVDNLDEAAAAEALDLLSGHIAPVDVLLQGKEVRWGASLQLDKHTEDETTKMMRSLLLLMRIDGTVPQHLYPPPVSNDEDVPKEIVNPETVLDLTNISSCRDLDSTKAEKEMMLTSGSLAKVKRLTGLYCDRDNKWALQILKLVAPNLEEVHLHGFCLEHLEVVLSMPQLRWLVLDNLNNKIRSTDDYVLPPLQHQSKVEFLWCNVSGYKNTKLGSDIVTTYAASLKTLLASTPSYYGDTTEYFAKMYMPYLENLFFLSGYCDNYNCKEVMDSMRAKFPDIHLCCFNCGRTDTYDE